MTEDRLYPDRPFIAASLAVFRNGKVLLAARKETAQSPIYSFPGGVVELGETLQDAAIREVFEEIGVTARVIDHIDTIEFIERDTEGLIRRHFIIHTFVGEWISGDPKTSIEAPHVCWRDPNMLGGLTLTKGLPALLSKAAAKINSNG